MFMKQVSLFVAWNKVIASGPNDYLSTCCFSQICFPN